MASRGLSPPLSDAPIQDSSPAGSGRGEIFQPTQELGGAALGPFPSPAFYPNLHLSKAERRSTVISEIASDCGNFDDTGQTNSSTGAPRYLAPKIVCKYSTDYATSH